MSNVNSTKLKTTLIGGLFYFMIFIDLNKSSTNITVIRYLTSDILYLFVDKKVSIPINPQTKNKKLPLPLRH
jgi:hypothetical protein